jgi:hypothetical protein
VPQTQLFDKRAWPLLAFALVLLNASLTFQNLWPTAKIAWRNALSIELAVCVLLLALVRRHQARLTGHVLPVVWLALVVGHYLDVTGPGLYGRPFNLYWDAPHLGNVAAMLLRAVPLWIIGLSIAGAVLVLVVTFRVARFALRVVSAAMENRHARMALGTLAAAIVMSFVGQQVLPRFPTTITFAGPVTPSYVKQARFVMATLGPQKVAPTLGPSPNLDAELGGVAGNDVLLIFVESYGALTFDLPAIAEELAPSRADLAAAIRESGRRVVSGYVSSPTFGGSSWLAHLSFLSGVEVRDQYAYAALMTSSRGTAVTNFARRGYRTVALMPGMRQAWPEGAFYRFDAIYGRKQLDYEGPAFGWWSIPDQYALAKLDALERNHAPRAPLFVVFPTSTTHAPFGPVAPYQSDWSRILSRDAFDDREVERALAATPDLTNLRPSYVRAMAYEYAALAGYLRQHADDMLMIVIGDHQPPAAVSGTDASWDVPVHVIGRGHHVLDRLLAHGFGNGLEPDRPGIGAMHTLLPTLLNAFNTASAPAQAAY